MRIVGMKKVRTAVLAAVCCLGAAVWGQAADYVSVNSSGVNLRSGPDTSYSILFELPEGYPLKVVERQGQWLKVSDFENDEGWIYEPLVSSERYVIVTVEQGNVRSGPSINNNKIGSVVREVILRQIGRDGDWIQFEHPKLKGWIHSKLVWP
jgi:SH3-like domain-containing protein